MAAVRRILAFAGIALAASVSSARVAPGGDGAVASAMLDPALLEPATGCAPEVQLWFPADVSPARKKLPVLLYFPGWPGTGRDNDVLLQDIARQGFLIAAAAYPCQPKEFLAAMDFGSPGSLATTLRITAEKTHLGALDASRILDALDRLNQADPQNGFFGCLDIARAGIIGYSFGGSVAVAAAMHDRRFRAVLNLDGWLFGDAVPLAIAQPYMLMSDDTPPPSPSDLNAADASRRYAAMLDDRDLTRLRQHIAERGGYLLMIKGVGHGNFSDAAFAWRRHGDFGPIKAARAATIIRSYAVAFFRQHLEDQPSSLLQDADMPFPEARLDTGDHRTAP